MEHSWGKGIEVCTNEVPGVKNDPTLGDHNLYKNIHVPGSLKCLESFILRNKMT